MKEMKELENLKKKLENKESKKDLDLEIVKNEIIEEIKRNYRLINNTTRRIEKQLQYTEDKQNKILELLKYKPIDTEELQRQQEIKELEEKLRKLKGER